MLRRNRISFDVDITERPGEATILAEKAIQRGFRKIFAVGGDGTVNEVAQPLVGTGLALGIIPLGLANDLAKSLAIPLSLKKALKTACSENFLDIDVGQVSGTCLRSRYFVNALGLGFDVRVAEQAQRISNRLGNRGIKGNFPYIVAVLGELFSFRELPLSLKTPKEQHMGKHLAVIAANGRQEGRYFKIAPKARLNDGLLDICLLGPMGPFRRTLCVLTALKGKHFWLRDVRHLNVSQFSVTVPPGWNIHLDGEVINLTEEFKLTVRVLPQALRVIPGSCPEYLEQKAKAPLEMATAK